MFSEIDGCSSVLNKLSCGFAHGHKLQIWSGSPECLDHRNDRVIYLLEDSMHKPVTPATVAGKVPFLELT